MCFDIRSPLLLLVVAPVLVAVLVSGCDAVSSNEDAPTLRDQLVGQWIIEHQTGTYRITSEVAQTVLDPDESADGSLTLSGRWDDAGPHQYVDEDLHYARHGAISAHDGYRPTLLLSTAPIQNVEAVKTGKDKGFVVELRDVYDRQQNVFRPDGFLEGEIQTSYYEQYPGRPELASETLSAAPLPTPPLSAPVDVQISDLPFAHKYAGSDTIQVDGTLRLPTQTLAPDTETIVDVERTSSDRLARRRITYDFRENDSLFVSSVFDGDTLRIAGTWALRGDTLQLRGEEETEAALLTMTPGEETGKAKVYMQFDDPLCRSDDTDCFSFYEHTFGLRAGTLKGGTWRLENRLVPASESFTSRADRSKSICGVAPSSAADRGPGPCEARTLLRGAGAPPLMPSSPVASRK
jgi:hypothetical protein